MQIYSLPDITLEGFDTPTALNQTTQPCKWFQVTVLAASAADPRIGDQDVSDARGVPMGAGGGQFSPPIAEASNMYDIGQIYVAGTIGDTLAVIYGV